MDTATIQRALIHQGFDLGPFGADGAMGPLTRRAIAEFEAKHGLKADGEPDSAFIKTLLGSAAETPWFPWYAEAERRMGLNENRDKVELSTFLKSDGSSVGDPTKLPWCGDFVETCMALSLPHEPLPANPYLARNWLKFGVDCAPTEGAVLVFWRGSKTGTSGHVGFCAGEDSVAFHVLGGNQGNSVSIARIAKGRLLGARWPKCAPLTGIRRVEASDTGGLSLNEA